MFLANHPATNYTRTVSHNKSTELKKFYTILKRTSIIVVLLFIVLYFYTKNYWKNFTNETEISELVSEIKKADSLPEKFYELYEVEDPKSLTYDLNQQIITQIFSSNYRMSPSSQVALVLRLSLKKNKSFDNRRYILLDISLSWKIESQTTQKECLNWLAENSDFLYNTVGIKQASLRYFEKELAELNERELASLVIMMNNPSLYNPLKRKKLLDQRVNELLEKIK